MIGVGIFIVVFVVIGGINGVMPDNNLAEMWLDKMKSIEMKEGTFTN